MKTLFSITLSILLFSAMVFGQYPSYNNGLTNHGFHEQGAYTMMRGMCIDNSGNIWIGTLNKLYKYNKNTNIWQRIEKNVYSIIYANNTVYIGTDERIEKYENNTWNTVAVIGQVTEMCYSDNLLYFVEGFYDNTLQYIDEENIISGSVSFEIGSVNIDIGIKHLISVPQNTGSNHIVIGTAAGIYEYDPDNDEIDLLIEDIGVNAFTLYESEENTKLVILDDEYKLKYINNIYNDFESNITHPIEDLIVYQNNSFPEKFNNVIATNNKIYATSNGSSSIGIIEDIGVISIIEGNTSQSYILNSPDLRSDNNPIFLSFDNSGKLWLKNKLSYKNLFELTNIDEAHISYIHGTYLDINNVNAGFYFNTMFNDTREVYQPEYEVPNGGGAHSLYASGLRLGGIDDDNILHTACEMYDTEGEDFYPGPIMNENDYINEYDNWGRVWSVTRNQIYTHIYNYNNQNYIMPEDIRDWPGNGNLNLGQAEMLAPFTDVNGNGIYEPELGDYPDFPGDKCIYFIINDEHSDHLNSNQGYDDNTQQFIPGNKLGVEIHAMAYAYSIPNNEAINNTTFIRYKIINRSENNYHDFYAGLWSDLDLGNPQDDYTGCDTNLNIYYIYNGDNNDEVSSDFTHNHINTYGENPPAQGVLFLDHKMHSYMAFDSYYTSDNQWKSDPETAEQYYYYLTGRWKDGSYLHKGGTGYQGDDGVGDQIVKHIFPGYGYTTSWTETTEGNEPFDRRGIGSVGPMEFNSGDTISLKIAFIWARDEEGDNFDSVKKLLASVPAVQDFEDLSLSREMTTYKEVDPNIDIYPNPANNEIKVICTGETEIEIFSITGELVKTQNQVINNTTIDISDLNSGIYLVKIKSGNSVVTKKLIKQ